MLTFLSALAVAMLLMFGFPFAAICFAVFYAAAEITKTLEELLAKE